MTVTVKNKTPLVVPPSIRRCAGIKAGDTLEFKASGGVITITAKPESAEDEYTPEQRKRINARLKKALQDVEEGRFYGPFDSVAQLRDSVEQEIKKGNARKRKPAG